MKKFFAFIMSIMLILGVSGCTCTNQRTENKVDVVSVEDTTDVDSSIVLESVVDSTVVE